MNNQIITLTEFTVSESTEGTVSIYETLEGIKASDIDQLYTNASIWPIMFVQMSSDPEQCRKYINTDGVTVVSLGDISFHLFLCGEVMIQAVSGLTIKRMGLPVEQDLNDESLYFAFHPTDDEPLS